MSMTTNLYEQINDALKPVYLSQDEHDELEENDPLFSEDFTEED